MFDIMTYAANNAVSITTTPLFETVETNKLKRIYAWHIMIESSCGRCEKTIEQSTQDFKETLDSMLAEIRSKKAVHIKNKYDAYIRNEIEDMFKM